MIIIIIIKFNEKFLTQISQGELAQKSLRLRLLKIEFDLCVLVAAEHTTADEQHISHIFTDNNI